MARAALVVALASPAAVWFGLRHELVRRLAVPLAHGADAVGRASSRGDVEERPLLPSYPSERPFAAPGVGAPSSPPPTGDPSSPPPGQRSERADAAADPPPITTGGVFVSRARVESAVRAGIRPASGGHAPATTWRPAGTVVVGVGSLGLGLRDGDVITRIGGSPATSPNAVIGAVHAALRAGLPAISGEVWRGRQRISVTVELPAIRGARDSLDAGRARDSRDAGRRDEAARRDASRRDEEASRRQPEPRQASPAGPGATQQ